MRIFPFIKKQIFDIKRGGLPIFFKKIKLIFGYLVGSFFGSIILLVRPIVHIKFAHVDVLNFGLFFDQINLYYISEKTIKKESKKVRHIIFYSGKNFCNEAIKKICSRTIKVYEFNIVFFWIVKFFRLLKINDHLYFVMYSFDYGRYYLKRNNNFNETWGWSYPNYIKFTNDEKIIGSEILEKFNLSKKDKWICIHNRDDIFKKKTYTELNVERSHTHRNFEIKLLKSASEYFASKGYFVFRMGRMQKEKLLVNNEKVIDYAFSEYKSSFADIFLLSNCTAFFGSNSGVVTPCITFRKPVAHVNYIPLNLNHLTFYKTLPTIIKRIRCSNTGKLLSINEIFENNLMGLSRSFEIYKKGYEFVNNTEDEIKDLAVEICNYLDGNLNYTKDEKKNDERFNNLIFKNFKSNSLGQKKITIGKSFLMKNLNLLN